MNNQDPRQNDPLEPIAEALHNGFVQHRISLGYKHGPERDDAKKEHPHICDWRDSTYKTEAQRNGDRFQAALLLHWWVLNNFNRDDLPKAIHDAWRKWIWIQGHTNDHDKPYVEAHRGCGPYEHANQAELVFEILKGIRQRETPQSKSSADDDP